VYYLGVEKWGNAFAEDCGLLFELYVGRQLGTLHNVQVNPQVSHEKGQNRSVDWIVVCPNAVLLVEVKSVRPTEALTWAPVML
jgi:Nuclease-related domain